MHLKHLLCLLPLTLAGAALSPIHHPITRRGGPFPLPDDAANLPHLLEQLQSISTRYTATTRSFHGNQVVRKPKRLHGTQANTILLGEVGRDGNWFAEVKIGEPEQKVDMDLDMLTADWWVFSTSSGRGSFFLDWESRSYVDLVLSNPMPPSASCPPRAGLMNASVDSDSPLLFPTCRNPTDILHLPTINHSVTVSFAHCRPAKQWSRALLPSGAYLGLAPSKSLSQLKTPSLMEQLMDKEVIDTPIWSIVLLNCQEGLLSIGGTSVASVRQVERDTEDQLSHLEGHEEIKREADTESAEIQTLMPAMSTDDWKWVQVQGSDGWWQILMGGVWVDGVKLLHNQPVILDLCTPNAFDLQVNTPFILVPPMAARSFYSSISGSRQLPPPYDQFHSYPCLNPPEIHFEFAGWNVEVLKGRRDKGTSAPGGRFSLGRVAMGSGYCIGIVVESRIGVEDLGVEKQKEAGLSSGDGLADVWIIGEPFFRDVQVAFDWKTKKVGMQKV